MTPLRSVLAEVLGVVLAPALFFRAFTHILVAAARGYDPRLVDGSDLSLQSPVSDLRESTEADLARCASTVLAASLAITLSTLSFESVPGQWIVLNGFVLAADPVTGVLYRLRPTNTLITHT